MKSKAPLALMEQMVMLLVFALAAALCLQAFVKSDQISLKSQTRSNAAFAAQNTAEVIRYNGGSLEHALMETAKRQGGKYLEGDGDADGKLIIPYDGEWKATTQEAEYLLTVQGIPAVEKGLRKVRIQVIDRPVEGDTAAGTVPEELSEQDVLFELETAWLDTE